MFYWLIYSSTHFVEIRFNGSIFLCYAQPDRKSHNLPAQVRAANTHTCPSIHAKSLVNLQKTHQILSSNNKVNASAPGDLIFPTFRSLCFDTNDSGFAWVANFEKELKSKL